MEHFNLLFIAGGIAVQTVTQTPDISGMQSGTESILLSLGKKNEKAQSF